METLLRILDSKTGQALGVSVVFVALSWILWSQLTVQIDGRLESQDARIRALEDSNNYLMDFAKEEQAQRRTLFSAIETHLKAVSKHLEDYYE